MREDVSRASCGSKQQVDTRAVAVAFASYFLLHLRRVLYHCQSQIEIYAEEKCAIGKFSPRKRTYTVNTYISWKSSRDEEEAQKIWNMNSSHVLLFGLQFLCSMSSCATIMGRYVARSSRGIVHIDFEAISKVKENRTSLE